MNERWRPQRRFTRAETHGDVLAHWAAQCQEWEHCRRGWDCLLQPRQRSKRRRTSSSPQPSLTPRARPQGGNSEVVQFTLGTKTKQKWALAPTDHIFIISFIGEKAETFLINVWFLFQYLRYIFPHIPGAMKG